MPGVNVVPDPCPQTRPVPSAPYRRGLPWLGVALACSRSGSTGFGAIKPMRDTLTDSGTGRLNDLNDSGITGELVFAAIGLVI